MQIIILGMHRSGTSAVTRLVNMMGAYFGEESESIGAADENPKGFWERMDMISCNDRILEFRQATWDNTAHLSDVQELPEEIQSSMRAILQRLSSHNIWVVKDPRLCLTFSQWKPLLEKPVAVIVYRDPLEVVESLHTRNNIPLRMGLAMWEHNIASALTSAMDVPKIFIRHADVMQDPVKATHRLYEDLVRLGGNQLRMPDEQEIMHFIDPELYRSKPRHANGIALSEYQQELAAYASGSASLTKPLRLSMTAREYLELFAYIHADREVIKSLKTTLSEATLKIAASEQHVLQLKSDIEQLDILHRSEMVNAQAKLKKMESDAEALNARLNWIYSTFWWQLGKNFAAILRAIGLRK